MLHFHKYLFAILICGFTTVHTSDVLDVDDSIIIDETDLSQQEKGVDVNKNDDVKKSESSEKKSAPKLYETNSGAAGNTFINQEDVSDDIKKIIDRGQLRVGMCIIDQPPFHVKGRNGDFVGFDVDIARDLCVLLGVEMKIVEGADWDNVIDMLIAGKVDVIISNLSLTPERATKILCSRPYAKIRQCLLLNRVLLARAGGDNFTTLRQIFENYENNKLIIQEGTAFVARAASTFPKAKIYTTDSWKEIMKQILERKFMGTISDEIEIKQQLKEVRTMELLQVVLKGRYDLMVIGVPKNSTQLLHFINSYLESNNVECNVEDF